MLDNAHVMRGRMGERGLQLRPERVGGFAFFGVGKRAFVLSEAYELASIMHNLLYVCIPNHLSACSFTSICSVSVII